MRSPVYDPFVEGIVVLYKDLDLMPVVTIKPLSLLQGGFESFCGDEEW